MGSRVVASVILVAGITAVAWVALGGNEPASESAVSTAQGQEISQEVPDGDTATSTASPPTEATLTPTPTIEEPENYGPRMDLVDIDGWLNTDATTIDDFNGQVLLVEMWTFGCHNCKARIPFNQSYYEEFGDENFEILGVHAPEFSYEADVDNIVAAAEDLGVVWPIALDTEKRNFRDWQPGSPNFWPRTYVIDQNGDIRYDHIGEGRYEELRETIRYLIENPPAPKPAS